MSGLVEELAAEALLHPGRGPLARLVALTDSVLRRVARRTVTREVVRQCRIAGYSRVIVWGRFVQVERLAFLDQYPGAKPPVWGIVDYHLGPISRATEFEVTHSHPDLVEEGIYDGAASLDREWVAGGPLVEKGAVSLKIGSPPRPDGVSSDAYLDVHVSREGRHAFGLRYSMARNAGFLWQAADRENAIVIGNGVRLVSFAVVGPDASDAVFENTRGGRRER